MDRPEFLDDATHEFGDVAELALHDQQTAQAGAREIAQVQEHPREPLRRALDALHGRTIAHRQTATDR
jgi:hypothetical protein